ncbi:galactokinase [Bacillus gaemokensis]|uniref:Galactokinase n=1 Tax=Bacillus gaemokensis TaxID=574375 RepID=A0A073K6R8_9BACI|nr:galactokinase [Bacillus gaemokensis]KEK22949.1 galactokinase [Bacillus gaemokensis]KYG37495.1 galactokinase [Bacillus gaemokensis]
MVQIETLANLFQQKFNQKAYNVFFAPGRINLIGEHTDYNGGHVLPCSITLGTYALVRRRNDDLVRIYSMNFQETGVIEFSLKQLEFDPEHKWGNYPKGMIRYVLEAGHDIQSGMDILFYGTIPNGAGLSSSASIELVTGIVIEKLFDLRIDRMDLVRIGQMVENKFIGVDSGIMDQFAIGMGKEGHGMLLNCERLQYSYTSIPLENYNIIIMNTNKRRELASSKYNERRNECEKALHYLQEVIDIRSLGELTEEIFEHYKNCIRDETIRKRAKHAVYENSRTIKAFHELNHNNLVAFGKFMNESHCSLRDDYEVTGRELDTLVETAWEQQGVLGARMTGAGFGGCAITIVEKDYTSHFIDEVGKHYEKIIGYEATFYIAHIGDGAREISKEVLK